MKKSNLLRLSLVAVIPALFLATYKLYALIAPEQNSKCTKCHTEVVHADYTKTYIHRPMFDKSCVVCHLERLAQQRLLVPKKELEIPEGVKLVARNPLPETNLWFQVPDDYAGSEVFLRIRPEYGPPETRKLELLPIEQLNRLENDGMPPLIGEIKTTVERGIFITAQISWKTNKPTKSRVSYGIGNKLIDAPTDDSFSFNHMVELDALEKKSLYRFVIHSADMFENQQSSEELTFSTENPGSGIRDTRTSTGSSKGEIDLTEKIFRNDDNYVFSMASNQPVFITMYSDRKKKNFKSEGERLEAAKEKLKAEHAGFRSQFDITNTICIACHKQKVKLTLTHPVDVFPKAGMTIPPEYPTLPDGRITCSSCHSKHASDNKNRTVKSGRKELCTGCHKDFD